MPDQPPVVRRKFLGRLAAIGAAVTGAAALPSAADASPTNAETHPADAWLDEFKGIHKNIYDCTTAENTPSGFMYARNFFTANTGEIYKFTDADLGVIVSVRHLATVFGFNDAMWDKYKLGEIAKVNDGSAPSVKNPQTRGANELAKRGVVLTVCGLATAFYSRQVATKLGLKAGDVEADLRANLLTPTTRVVAAGVVVTNRAQEKGFAYSYVG